MREGRILIDLLFDDLFVMHMEEHQERCIRFARYDLVTFHTRHKYTVVVLLILYQQIRTADEHHAYLLPGAFDDTCEGRTRDPHLLRRIRLIEPLIVH